LVRNACCRVDRIKAKHRILDSRRRDPFGIWRTTEEPGPSAHLPQEFPENWRTVCDRDLHQTNDLSCPAPGQFARSGSPCISDPISARQSRHDVPLARQTDD
jgi:hypothetical protein